MNKSIKKAAVVITTINSPSLRAFTQIVRRIGELGADFIIVGDSKTPANFHVEGAQYFDLRAQIDSGLAFANACPVKHYARKNVGYLLAMRNGAEIIIETDDDNIPQHGFYEPRVRRGLVAHVTEPGWYNVYNYFTKLKVWPRGLPLTEIQQGGSKPVVTAGAELDCPIQQGLADLNPDVDAIFRLIFPLPVTFEPGRRIALTKGVWCPFNSQNTTWWRDTFPLLYLPYHCSFRVTDIWRSFVAQRIAWENGWTVLFHSPTVYQERNEHDLMNDFFEEVPGYVENDRIRGTLENLSLRPGIGELNANLMQCYEALIKLGVIGAGELYLLRAWIADLESIQR